MRIPTRPMILICAHEHYWYCANICIKYDVGIYLDAFSMNVITFHLSEDILYSLSTHLNIKLQATSELISTIIIMCNNIND